MVKRGGEEWKELRQTLVDCWSVEWFVNSRVKRVLSQKGYQAYFISELPILNETKTVFNENNAHKYRQIQAFTYVLIHIYKEQNMPVHVFVHGYKRVSSKYWSVEHLKRCWLNWSTLNWIRTLLRTIVTMASLREHDGEYKISFTTQQQL